jgi:chaperonin GroES
MIRPLHDRVVLKRLPEEQTTRGGIYIPDAYVDKPQMCEVIAVGEGKPFGPKTARAGGRMPMTVKLGDCVLIGKYDGNEVKVDGEELVITREEYLLAVIERSSRDPDPPAAGQAMEVGIDRGTEDAGGGHDPQENRQGATR